ncbi:indole-3-glycerol phosphate synthase TrpC [Bacillus luteolus]|uniref:Indole-3-glycerol phosphate synthase n=1 Tax=Litchfieldia luteola TaxID=682179 RepID=A0ABR9QP44_9BACI|nr:indole-3-glycerol phosphate synthase TrpC [Cytobacillus luteolus]MBE4910280.1 indole-3-glycerol phosphate synthase TrpC [Cytobacillus luteolus]MBP1942147.1 indole-3-glycerol phosphate synthase [Cytobacillus luteolus]
MLTKIIETKYEEVKKIILPEYDIFDRKSLYKALHNSNREIGLIAEVKKASPSKGIIRQEFNPTQIALDYMNVHVDAMSVLTDELYFQGSSQYLRDIKELVDVPVLRKDFIVDSLQIEQSVRVGADAILLIGEVLEPTQLHEFYSEAYEKGLECLVEVHSYEILEKILKVFEPKILGVNNRNLKTFSTSILQTKELVTYIPPGSLLVSESGIHSHQDLLDVKGYGAKAVLVGEAFMKVEKPGDAVRELFGEKINDEG